jgi:hypothetical protein
MVGISVDEVHRAMSATWISSPPIKISDRDKGRGTTLLAVGATRYRRAAIKEGKSARPDFGFFLRCR